MKYIEVLKVTEKKKRKEDMVIDPISNKPIPEHIVKSESIEISDIRSFRNWDENEITKQVDSKLTMIYMKGSKNPKEKSTASMLIAEDYNKFKKRMPVITLED